MPYRRWRAGADPSACAGIDFAGTVEDSEDSRYKPGDKVVLTGRRVGEVWWGGYARKARVMADWLVPFSDGLSTKQAMAVGTAGFTAMHAVMALEDHGLTPDRGEFLVTGAAGCRIADFQRRCKPPCFGETK